MYQEFLDFSFMHKKLQELMKKELDTLRSVLDLLKEEEIAYLKDDISHKKNLFLKKNETNKALKKLQKERNALTKSLAETTNSLPKHSHLNSEAFNTIISKDHENSVETFHLRDQIMHFMKTIKTQKERLICLKKQTDSRGHGMQLDLAPRKLVKKNRQIQTLPLESSSSQEM